MGAVGMAGEQEVLGSDNEWPDGVFAGLGSDRMVPIMMLCAFASG